MTKSIRAIAGGSVIQQLVSVGIFLILTRALGAEAYGVVATATALATSSYSFGSFWAVPFIVRSGVNQIATSGGLGDTFWKGGIIVLTGTLTAIAALFVLHAIGAVKLPVPFYLVFFLALSIVLMALLRTGVQTIQDFRLYGRLLWIDRIFLLVLLLLLLALSRLTSTSAIVVSAFASLFVALSGLIFFFTRYVVVRARSFSLGDFFKSSTPVFVSTAILYFSSASFLVFAIATLFGLHEAAWTGVAFAATGLMTQPIMWVTPTLLPRFTRSHVAGTTDDFRMYLQSAVLPLLTIYALATVGTILLLPLLPFVLGPDYRGAGPIVGLVLSAFVAEVVNLLVVQLLYARHQEKVLLLVSATKAVGPLVFFFARGLLNLPSFALMAVASYWLSIVVELWALRDLLSPRFVRYMVYIAVLSLAPSIAFAFAVPLSALIIIGSTAALGVLTWAQRSIIAQRAAQLGALRRRQPIVDTLTV